MFPKDVLQISEVKIMLARTDNPKYQAAAWLGSIIPVL